MSNKRQVVAIVPVREGSQRVKSKNFTDFYNGKSLTDIKVDQLKSSGIFDHIYLSSDSERVKSIANRKEVDFLLRAEDMCASDTPWYKVVDHILSDVPGNPIVVWALTTAPLFYRFREAVEVFLKYENDKDSLIGVLPKKSFFINKAGRGINFNPGIWHPYSQQLDIYYEVTGSVYVGGKENMQKWHYWFGTKPELFHVTNLESIDVDTPDDFLIAQKLYEVTYENSHP